jgi:hypothetical protein
MYWTAETRASRAARPDLVSVHGLAALLTGLRPVRDGGRPPASAATRG